MIDVHPIPAFSDNYIWCLDRAGQAFVVDPGDAAPVEAFLAERAMTLTGILITHHHFDHVGGLEQLLANREIPVFGPAESSPLINRPVTDGDRIEVLGQALDIFAVPGHTLDHIAYLAPEHEPPLLFCGDTLFAGGCGRLFEGTPAQMHASLGRLKALPGETEVYCAHEYTLANLKFALAVEPDNAALTERAARERQRRDRDQPTVPSTLAVERATNPFLRCEEANVRASASGYANMPLETAVDTFAAVRRWKDSF